VAGNVAQDPELRSLPSGTQVCELRVATHRVFTSQGQNQEETEFHNVVIWGKQADIAARYLKKGALVLVRGRLHTRTWDDKTAASSRKPRLSLTPLSWGQSKPARQANRKCLPWAPEVSQRCRCNPLAYA